MMAFFRHFDPQQVRVDFLVHGDGRGVYDDEIEAAGSRIWHVPVRGSDPRGNEQALRRAMSEGGYDAVHAHTDANNAHVLAVAAACGVPMRVSHSHNTDTQTDSRLKHLYNAWQKKRIPRYATHLLACSEQAGRWLYGDRPFTVIPNAIDCEAFRFDPAVRDRVRAELHIPPEAFVAGHVGRFAYQKNHEKLVAAFAALCRQVPEAMLLLIGDGETRPAVTRQIAELGLTDRVRFVEPTPRVADYLQAMDCFVLPSRFEGLGIVLIEAQAAGLPCVAADTVPQMANAAGMVRYLPLSAADEAWARAIASCRGAARDYPGDRLAENGFDIRVQAARLQRFYQTGEWA